MSDGLPVVTSDFLSLELSRTIPKPMKKMGGPYTKSDRIKRRNEVFRLHFSIGYSAVKISELLHVNRHTIESDIKHGYSILTKEWQKGNVESWFMKQVYRLEEQRTRLLKKLESSTGREYLAIENLLKEIDGKIFNMQKDVITSKDTIHEINIKEINRYLKENFSDDRIISIFAYRKVSAKTEDTINELIEKDHQENTGIWV